MTLTWMLSEQKVLPGRFNFSSVGTTLRVGVGRGWGLHWWIIGTNSKLYIFFNNGESQLGA